MTKRIVGLVVMAVSVCAAQAQNITVYSSGNVTVGTARQLTAYVPLSPNTVTWSVNGVNGGDATYGTVTASGLYQAPAIIPAANTVSVRATSTAYPKKYGTVKLTITQPPVQLWSTSPTSVPVGPFALRLNGANFHAGSVVKFGGVTLPTTVLSSTSLTATGTALSTQAGTSVAVVVVNGGLGGTTSSAVQLRVTAAPAVTVAITPASPSVPAGDTQTFQATVSGSTNTAVTWFVSDIEGGNAMVGTVSNTGLYRAPATPPPSAVAVRATSAANPSVSATALVTVLPPPPPPVVSVTVSPVSVSVAPAGTRQFTAVVSGTTTTTVTWSVNGVTGGSAATGSITAAGLYTAPATVAAPTTVSIRATSTVSAAASGTASVTIAPFDPGTGQGTGNLAAARLLEQAAFGPNPVELARVKGIGIPAWIDEQLALPETAIANPGGMGMGAVQSQYLNRLSQAPDQLRQRVAYALSQVIVISANKNIYPDEIVPYLQMLSRHAFGNYRALLGEISTSSQMGKYLDLANSNKPTAGSAANENYARELMQLFTIGLYQLNSDGSRQLDALGNPVRAYDQATVQQVALALTGWTYAGAGNNNWENFSGPLVAREVNHDTSAKALVGITLPAGQTAAADMAGTLDWLFNHPNVGPFLATRLIRALVKSNPTPAYVARIAAVFDDDGGGTRGNLRAVVRAILLDAEARADEAAPDGGRLKDPLYHAMAFLRALGGHISATNVQAWTFSRMSQTPLAPASVFGFYSPLFRIPRSTLVGPEFQIYGPTEAVLRGNLFWEILSNPGSDFPVDITPFVALAGDTVALIDAVDQTLLYGRMPAAMRQSLANAINAQGDAVSKARTALYLTSLSGYYAVQY
ncbi:DUF1800 family protein [Horticoccus sp. 23ND18S-11]|uniref:DUF1800 family protein n=1 Tax=Horticoccus sp. 23ND18S-11 TaxID=3391832 RepID=UPI0039C9E2A5